MQRNEKTITRLFSFSTFQTNPKKEANASRLLYNNNVVTLVADSVMALIVIREKFKHLTTVIVIVT